MVRAHSEKIEFVGSQGNLAARLDFPAEEPLAFALFAHCFTCGKDLVGAPKLARALARMGIAVLRFDFTGLGHSEGEFANTNFSSNIEDLVAAANYLRREHRAPSLLVGHSLGGAAVLAAAGRIPEARAVATLGAPGDPSHVKRLFADRAQEIEQAGEALVELAGRRFRIRGQFLEDLSAHKLRDAIASLRKALLVMHAPMDSVVGIDNASEIFLAAKHPKSFVSLDDADHLLTRRSDAEYAAGVLVAWARRYLPTREVPAKDREEPRDVVVGESGEGRFQQDVRVGPHRLVADEPSSVGGDDGGPTPYEFLLAGLGACTTMTLRMYADRKGWPLEASEVRLRHQKIHARDCEECETATGKIDDIEREINLRGPLDADQRKRLLEIADRCPVHRTLHSEVRVRSRGVDAP